MDRVLLIEDEPSIVKLIRLNLEKSGYEVEASLDGLEGFDLALHQEWDCIILDLMLPGKDGMDICRDLRLAQKNTPIIMLTARDEEIDKILGLELGADDYMTKPFSPRELIARIKAVRRRMRQELSKADPLTLENTKEKVIHLGDLIINEESFEVTLSGVSLTLTRKEFELLTYMAKREGRTLSRDILLEAVWDYPLALDTRIVDVHISHLREKLGEDHPYIQTVRGFGYKLVKMDD